MNKEFIEQRRTDLCGLVQDRDRIAREIREVALDMLRAFKEEYNTNVIYFDEPNGQNPSALYIGGSDMDAHDINITSINIDELTFTGNAYYEGNEQYDDLSLDEDTHEFDWEDLANCVYEQLGGWAFFPEDDGCGDESDSEEDL